MLVRGVVSDSSGAPLPDVRVAITGLASDITVRIMTAGDGSFRATVPAGSEAVRIELSRIGFAPQQLIRRVVAGASDLTLRLQMDARLFELREVVARGFPATTGSRERPGVGGIDRDALGNRPFTGDPSDLDELAALLPGVTLGDSGFSVLGAGADQNNLIINGTRFSGGELPPDALASVRVATSTFDPSRGEFSGALVSVSTKSGSDIPMAAIRSAVEPGVLEWRDALQATGSGTMAIVSGFAGGPIRPGASHYFSAFQWRQEDRALPSVLTLNRVAADRLGVPPDSVARFLETLEELGLLAEPSDGTRAVSRTRATASTQVDLRLGSVTSLRLLGIGSATRAAGQGVGVLAVPSVGFENAETRGRAAVTLSTVIGLMSLESQLTASHARVERELASSAPAGRVTVASERMGYRVLSFGGGGIGEQVRTETDTEWRAELKLPSTRGHRISVGGNLRASTVQFSSGVAPAGLYHFESLADLAANRPGEYRRVREMREAEGRTGTAALWVGDEFRPNAQLIVQWGVRADWSRPHSQVRSDSGAFAELGVRTGDLPTGHGISPRVGFQWSSLRSRTTQRSETASQGEPFNGVPGMGSGDLPVDRLSDLVALADLMSRPGVNISGGVGTFRSELGPSAGRIASLVSRASAEPGTGIIRCIGADVLSPTWSELGGSGCRDGSLPTALVVRRDLTAFAPGYSSPRRVSANLGIAGFGALGWRVGIIATHARFRSDVPTDRNLREEPTFVLDGEAARPVYAPVEDIDSGTGRHQPAASRRVQELGRVSEIQSSDVMQTTEVIVQLLPPASVYSRFQPSLAYVASHRAQDLPGEALTAGDPRRVGSLATVQHQVILMASHKVWWMRIGARMQFESGVPYSPVVDGDVNGDGLLNDLAFIPPAWSGAELEENLFSAPSHARTCVRRQAGRIASPASCQGPWTSRLDLVTGFEPPRRLGVGQNLSLSFAILNAGAGLRRLVGWSGSLFEAAAPPDPRLQRVTGFDPDHREYSYVVNPGFGRPFGGETTERFYPPVRIQLRGEWRFGGRSAVATIRPTGLHDAPPEGWTPGAARDRASALVSNPVRVILAFDSSLGLRPAQRDSLEGLAQEADRLFLEALQPLVDRMVERGRRLTDADAVPLLATLRGVLNLVGTQSAEAAEALLDPVQREILRLELRRRPAQLPL